MKKNKLKKLGIIFIMLASFMTLRAVGHGREGATLRGAASCGKGQTAYPQDRRGFPSGTHDPRWVFPRGAYDPDRGQILRPNGKEGPEEGDRDAFTWLLEKVRSEREEWERDRWSFTQAMSAMGQEISREEQAISERERALSEKQQELTHREWRWMQEGFVQSTIAKKIQEEREYLTELAGELKLRGENVTAREEKFTELQSEAAELEERCRNARRELRQGEVIAQEEVRAQKLRIEKYGEELQEANKGYLGTQHMLREMRNEENSIHARYVKWKEEGIVSEAECYEGLTRSRREILNSRGELEALRSEKSELELNSEHKLAELRSEKTELEEQLGALKRKLEKEKVDRIVRREAEKRAREQMAEIASAARREVREFSNELADAKMENATLTAEINELKDNKQNSPEQRKGRTSRQDPVPKSARSSESHVVDELRERLTKAQMKNQILDDEMRASEEVKAKFKAELKLETAQRNKYEEEEKNAARKSRHELGKFEAQEAAVQKKALENQEKSAFFYTEKQRLTEECRKLREALIREEKASAELRQRLEGTKKQEADTSEYNKQLKNELNELNELQKALENGFESDSDCGTIRKHTREELMSLIDKINRGGAASPEDIAKLKKVCESETHPNKWPGLLSEGLYDYFYKKLLVIMLYIRSGNPNSSGRLAKLVDIIDGLENFTSNLRKSNKKEMEERMAQIFALIQYEKLAEFAIKLLSDLEQLGSEKSEIDKVAQLFMNFFKDPEKFSILIGMGMEEVQGKPVTKEVFYQFFTEIGKAFGVRILAKGNQGGILDKEYVISMNNQFSGETALRLAGTHSKGMTTTFKRRTLCFDVELGPKVGLLKDNLRSVVDHIEQEWSDRKPFPLSLKIQPSDRYEVTKIDLNPYKSKSQCNSVFFEMLQDVSNLKRVQELIKVLLKPFVLEEKVVVVGSRPG